MALAVAVVVPAAAQADSRDDVINAMAKCAQLQDKMARADCFDRVTPQLHAVASPQSGMEEQVPEAATPASAAASAPLPGAMTSMPPVAQAEPGPPPSQDTSWMSALDPFSGGAPDKPAPDQLAYQAFGREILPITIGVADFQVYRNGVFSVTLDNGQVWREHDRDYATPPFRKNEKNIVTIERGMLGGFNLVLEGNPTIYKVVRLK